MVRAPELIIGYDENYFPKSATCSFCGEPMPDKGSALTTSEESIARFKPEFDLHLDRRHKRRDVN
jgi:hypothetical protein